MTGPGTPPPFHSREQSRTRPARRRRLARPVSLVPSASPERLGRTFLVLAVLFAVAIIAAAAFDRWRDSGDEPEVVPVANAIMVGVERIIDGDTLDVRSASTTLRVRLYGIDAPERDEACAAEATSRLTALAGERVQLLPDVRLQDAFGRELRYVYALDGTSIDETIVREGLALAWRDDGSMRDALVAEEEEARAAERGCLWSK